MQSKLSYLIGWASALTLGCSSDGDASKLDASPPMIDGGGASSGGGNAGARDASADGGNTAGEGGEPDSDRSLFGDPPYERIKMPVRRLSVYDDDYCVILEDRSLHCGTRGNTPVAKPPRGSENDAFVMVVRSRTAFNSSAIALREDGSVVLWTTNLGSLDTVQLPGKGYIGMMYFGESAAQDTLCGLTALGKLECAGVAPAAAVLDATFVQVTNMNNGPCGLTPQGEAMLLKDGKWTRFLEDHQLVTLDHAHYAGRCGVDTEGALHCAGVEKPLTDDPRDYALSPSNLLCTLAQNGRISCRDILGLSLTSGRRSWDSPADEVFVDVDCDSASHVCAVNVAGQLKCFDLSEYDGAPELVPLPMPAAVGD